MRQWLTLRRALCCGAVVTCFVMIPMIASGGIEAALSALLIGGGATGLFVLESDAVGPTFRRSGLSQPVTVRQALLGGATVVCFGLIVMSLVQGIEGALFALLFGAAFAAFLVLSAWAAPWLAGLGVLAQIGLSAISGAIFGMWVWWDRGMGGGWGGALLAIGIGVGAGAIYAVVWSMIVRVVRRYAVRSESVRRASSDTAVRPTEPLR